jgi:hypothetical protein
MHMRLILVELALLLVAVLVSGAGWLLRRVARAEFPVIARPWLMTVGLVLIAACLEVIRRTWEDPQPLRYFMVVEGLGVCGAIFLLIGVAELLKDWSSRKHEVEAEQR